jgi:hypothetical protein
MEDKRKTLFRKETLDRISSPEQLNDYLHVTSPGIWVVLIAVILLMAGVFVWSCVGTLETKSPAKMIVKDHVAKVVVMDDRRLEEGMIIRGASQEFFVSSVAEDEHGRQMGIAEASLPDGKYDAIVVTEQTRPVEFILKAEE